MEQCSLGSYEITRIYIPIVTWVGYINSDLGKVYQIISDLQFERTVTLQTKDTGIVDKVKIR